MPHFSAPQASHGLSLRECGGAEPCPAPPAQRQPPMRATTSKRGQAGRWQPRGALRLCTQDCQTWPHSMPLRRASLAAEAGRTQPGRERKLIRAHTSREQGEGSAAFPQLGPRQCPHWGPGQTQVCAQTCAPARRPAMCGKQPSKQGAHAHDLSAARMP